jgi:Tol biopolymer transport system component
MMVAVAGISFAAHFSFSKDNPIVVKPFIPEIVKQFPDVRDVAISPNGSEVYFTIQSYANEISAIVFVTQTDGTHSKPQVASFSGKYGDMEPCFSSDGLRLYFVSNRPNTMQETTESNYDIWYVERKSISDAWSAPVNMGPPVNTSENEFYPSLAKNGNLYFTCDGTGSKGKDDIFLCEFKNGKYTERISLSDSINSAGYEFNAFVAPDESYMIYTCYNKKGDFGSGDLYFSRRENGVWEKSTNLGSDVNTPKMEYCPFVDTKNGVLYFTSRRNKVNTTFDREQTLDELLGEMNRYENGQSRLYEVGYRTLIVK